MTIGIMVAMDSEFALVKQALDNVQIKHIKHLEFACGEINSHQVVLLKSGIGKVNSALACSELIQNFNPRFIINTGLAGGLDKSLTVMDIVVGKEMSYHDVWCGEGNEYGQVQGLPARFYSEAELVKQAQSIETDIKIHSGLLVGGDKFITSAKELETIKSAFPQAVAVDMESVSIAQTCYIYKVPFLSFRIISDTPGIDNHYQQYQNFWSQAPEKTLEVIKKLLA